MKTTCTLALLLLVAPCARAEAPWSGTDRIAVSETLIALCENVDNSGACARTIERRQARASAPAFRRSGTRLEIRVKNGPPVLLLDSASEAPDYVAYSYIEYLPAIRQHLVHVQPYEGQSFVLVDAESGTKTEIAGVPLVAGDGKRLACMQANDETQHSLEVWSLTGGRWQREFELHPVSWYPIAARWIATDRLEVKASNVDSEHRLEFRWNGTAWLLDRGAEWILKK